MIKKSFKKYLFCISLFMVSAFCLPTMISAAGNITIDGNVDTYDTITSAINAASDDDIIVVPAGTYNENLNISKNITIAGADQTTTIINGNITVGSNVTIQDVKIVAASNEAVTVTGAFELGVFDVTIHSKGSYGTGIWLNANADGATLVADGVTIDAIYGVWVRGASQTVSITNSDIRGFAALDISGGAIANGNTTLKDGNKITVEKSTLTGVNNQTTNDSNHYGTVVMGAQSNAVLVITDSTVTNEISSLANKGNNESLFRLNSPEYTANKNCTVGIINSKLINTDTTHNSAIYMLGNVVENNLALYTDNVTITSANDIIFDKTGGADTLAYVTFKDGNETIIVSTTIGTKVDDAGDGEKAGYTFLGWYTEDGAKWDFNNNVNNDITLTAKYKINNNEQESPITDIENPNTSDNILLYIVLGLMTTGCGIVTYRKLKNN